MHRRLVVRRALSEAQARTTSWIVSSRRSTARATFRSPPHTRSSQQVLSIAGAFTRACYTEYPCPGCVRLGVMWGSEALHSFVYSAVPLSAQCTQAGPTTSCNHQQSFSLCLSQSSWLGDPSPVGPPMPPPTSCSLCTYCSVCPSFSNRGRRSRQLHAAGRRVQRASQHALHQDRVASETEI